MRKVLLVLLIPWLLITTGACSYKGAVYADYTQTGLGVRAAPETGTPAEVHFGYDRGVFASVPKKTGKRGKGEAVAIISKNNVYTAKLSDTSNEEIRVDAAFLTGMAAQIAGLPKDSIVDLSAHPGVAPESGPITVEGTMDERINPLFRSTPRYTTLQQRTLQGLYDQINNREDKEMIYDLAAKTLPPDFQQNYETVKAKVGSAMAFRSSGIDYLTTGDAKKRQKEMIDALQNALAGKSQ